MKKSNTLSLDKIDELIQLMKEKAGSLDNINIPIQKPRWETRKLWDDKSKPRKVNDLVCMWVHKLSCAEIGIVTAVNELWSSYTVLAGGEILTVSGRMLVDPGEDPPRHDPIYENRYNDTSLIHFSKQREWPEKSYVFSPALPMEKP